MPGQLCPQDFVAALGNGLAQSQVVGEKLIEPVECDSRFGSHRINLLTFFNQHYQAGCGVILHGSKVRIFKCKSREDAICYLLRRSVFQGVRCTRCFRIPKIKNQDLGLSGAFLGGKLDIDQNLRITFAADENRASLGKNFPTGPGFNHADRFATSRGTHNLRMAAPGTFRQIKRFAVGSLADIKLSLRRQCSENESRRVIAVHPLRRNFRFDEAICKRFSFPKDFSASAFRAFLTETGIS